MDIYDDLKDNHSLDKLEFFLLGRANTLNEILEFLEDKITKRGYKTKEESEIVAKIAEIHEKNKKRSEKIGKNVVKEKRIMYIYPDGHWDFNIEKCIWNKGLENEYEGYPSCTAQLVCPYVKNWCCNADVGVLEKCNNDCRDERIREAIEAWISLHPKIF